MRTLFLLLAVAGTLAAQSGKDLMGNPEAIVEGKELYLTVCSGCHGAGAEGSRGPNLITGLSVRRASDEQLFDSIKNGIKGSDMPPSPLPPEQVWRIAAYVRSLSAPAFHQQAAGDPDAGRSVYFSKGKCDNCHMIRGEGGFLGPDLTNIGMTANLTALREGVFDPNKRTTQGFRPVVVTTASGETIRGVAKNNSNYSLQLLDNKGRLLIFQKRELSNVEFQEKSWMPADYSDRLSEKEQDDLLAFLARQAVRAP